MSEGPGPRAQSLGGSVLHPLPSLNRAWGGNDRFDDLGWLSAAIGNARVVAIGESAHYNSESYRLRHRLLRYLVQEHGFSGYAMESGFVEGWRANDWVLGRTDTATIGDVLANGMTSLMGMWVEMRDHLEWMRRHNAGAEKPVRFYGIDPPGSNLSLLPGLDLVIDYLAEADPGFTVDARLRIMAESCAASSNFGALDAFAAYAGMGQDRKDALTAGLAVLLGRMRAKRPDYLARTSVALYERALQALRLTVAEDIAGRDRGVNVRDVAQADTVDWILDREDRIVLGAHNGHLQRWPLEFPGAIPTMTSLGQHLAARLGEDYLVIATTTCTGRTLAAGEYFYAGRFFTDLPAPEPGTLDALMDTYHTVPFALDLRRLSLADRRSFAAIAQQRSGTFSCPIDPLAAYDIVIHLPQVTAAEPAPEAIASAQTEVTEAFLSGMSAG